MKKLNKLHEDCFEVGTESVYSSIYQRLASNRVIFLKEILTKEVASSISSLLIYYDNQSHDEEIFMYIHTDGGDVSAFFNIYDVMKLIKAPVTTICVGKAYSAGAFLLASGDKRYMYKNSKVMIHGVQFTFPLDDNSNTYYKFINDSNESLIKLLAKHTKQDLAKVRSDTSRDLFMNSSEAYKYGLIDEIF